MRRTLTVLVLITMAAFWSACGGSNTSVNAGQMDDDSAVNSERIESSNIAPTGGPGPEPESRGTQSSENGNSGKAENKNKAESNKNKNTQ